VAICTLCLPTTERLLDQELESGLYSCTKPPTAAPLLPATPKAGQGTSYILKPNLLTHYPMCDIMC